MKKHINSILLLCLLMFSAATVTVAQKAERKAKTVDSKASSVKSDEVNKLAQPSNEKKPKPDANKSRGDVYGPNYSDIIVDNYTGWSIDIYVDGSYRGTIAPYDRKVTWAIPGNTQLYGKATFVDGSYMYWGPMNASTGYAYTWNLHP